MHRWLKNAALLFAWSWCANATRADQPIAMPALRDPAIESILQRLDRLEAENAALRSQFDEPPAASSTADLLPTVDDASEEVKLCGCQQTDCARCRANASARRGYPTIQWNGFLQLDTGWVSQDAANVAAVGNVEAQTGLRRVRLRASGRVRSDISYVVDLDFAAGGHPSFRDVMFTIHERPVVQNLAIGYFQQPFGLDAMTSGRDLVLMERQLPFAFAPFRQTGFQSFGVAADERVTWAHSAFAFPTDSFGVSKGGQGGWAYATRWTGLLVDEAESQKFVHVGGSYCFQDPGNDIARYSIQPGFFVTDPGDRSSAGNVPVFVDTGDIPAQNVNLFDVELAGLWGPASVQAEAVRSAVNQDVGPQLNFSGASGKVGYIITGETHAYQRDRGVVGGVRPASETTSFFEPFSGAWEVTAGWAWINLDDKNVRGGEMQTFIVGLNRYMNSFTKLQLNVIRTLLDSPVDGQSAATVVAMRAQAQF